MISVIINGSMQQFEGPISVAHLIKQMALMGKRIAIELNGEIVPRSRFGEVLLSENDRVEVIVAVGGG